MMLDLALSWPEIEGNFLIPALILGASLLMGFVLWIATFYMIINLLIDASYYVLNPRLKKGGE